MFYPLAQLRQIEQQALSLGLPLMARAGQAAADFISARFGCGAAVLVLAGPGNNGGDALVAARLLRQRGHRVDLLLAADPRALPADAAAALADWLAAGGQVQQSLPAGPHHLAIDGLFGIGLNRPLAPSWHDLIHAVNARQLPLLALDVPSGVLADSGAVPGPALRARWTLSFIGTARGLVTGAACNQVGERHLADLALPLSLRPAGELADGGALARSLRLARPADSHKGRFGTVAIIGAAAGMAGAGLLAGRAALHAGAGKVLLGQLDPDGPRVDPLRPELMLRGYEASLLVQADVLAVGPGLGQSDAAHAAVAAALASARPLLLDADALNLLAGDPALATSAAQRQLPTVLTPHPSEAARLLGCSTAAIQAQRFDAATALAQRFAATVVLKGAGSLVAEHARSAIHTGGSAAMANAGQGDVLSGLIAALLAQGLDGWQAANLGVWAQAEASAHWLARDGRLVTLADELAQAIGPVLGHLRQP